MLATVLVFLLGIRALTLAQDICTTGNYTILNDTQGQRSSHFAATNGVHAICDTNLAPKWYRVQSPAGVLMPTACVQPFNCSTRLPVWLNGTYPSAGEGVVSRTACYSDGKNCCRDPFTIQVRNCTDFILFRLQNTSTCDSAYCFGDRVPCPAGYGSPDGFEPGCKLITTTPSPPEPTTNSNAPLLLSGWLPIPLLTLHLWVMRPTFDLGP